MAIYESVSRLSPERLHRQSIAAQDNRLQCHVMDWKRLSRVWVGDPAAKHHDFFFLFFGILCVLRLK
jgi:hypothetical protein